LGDEYVLALDEGTTSARAILFDELGSVRDVGQRGFRQLYPEPGWVEHDPENIWDAQMGSVKEALDAGCDGVLLSHPILMQANDDETYSHFAAVASKVDIPIIMYNNPGLGKSMSPSVIERLGEEYDNIVSYKEDDFSHVRFAEIIRRNRDQITLFTGSPAAYLSFLTHGAHGALIGVPGIPAPHEGRQREPREGRLLPREDNEDVQHYRHLLRGGQLLGQIQGDMEAEGPRHGVRREGPVYAIEATAAGEGEARVHEAGHRRQLVRKIKGAANSSFF